MEILLDHRKINARIFYYTHDLIKHFEGLACRKKIDILIGDVRVGRMNVTDLVTRL
jgi:hypothetical protein